MQYDEIAAASAATEIRMYGKISPPAICARLAAVSQRRRSAPSRDDLRTLSEAADLPQGVRGGKGRERREDGADDHHLNNDSKLASLRESNAGTVLPRRSRIDRLANICDFGLRVPKIGS